MAGKEQMGSVTLVVACLRAMPVENMTTRTTIKASLFMALVQSTD